MIKCILIYLWIYIGLFYMIEAGDDDEHVHIKLHMTSGQRKRAQIKQHHKKRHTPPPPPSGTHHHHHHHHQQQQHSHPLPPPPATSTTNLYHESPHNYLTGITSTSSSSSLVPQQHVFEHSAHSTKKFPSSSPLHLHESGQLLNMDEELYGQGDVVVTTDTEVGEPMMIPSYLAKNFASFPKPTTTYETEIIPHDSEGFNVVGQGLDGLDDLEEDNEITAPAGRGAGSLESIMLAEQMENYKRHKPSSSLSSSPSSTAKTIKNEQLLQQLLQQEDNEKQEIMNAAAYKLTKLRGNKYRAEKDYNSEDDMTEAMMYSSGHNPATHTFNRPIEDVAYSGSIKALTVDDIWSQLQQQYLSKYAPQAQPLISADSEEQPLTTTPTKAKPKRKRNTKRHKHAKPTTASYSTSWPAKPVSYSSSNHHKHQPKQHQHYYDDIRSYSHSHSPSASAFSSGSSSLSSHRDTDLFIKRPFNKFTAHDDEDDTAETDDDSLALYGEEADEDDADGYGDNADNNQDESFEEVVYQRGKKYAGHTAYGQHSHTSNPFNYHDLYGSYSTPATATVATNLQPSTYHPNLVSSTLPSYTAASSSSFLPTISHPSTSYQWRTQQNYPASYQTYHLQHQLQQPDWTAASGEDYAQQQQQQQHHRHHQHHPQQRLPKATITQTANSVTSSKLSPTQSNDFTVSSSSSSSSSAKSTAQTPTRYKKRKNRIKTKRNRIVVI